MAPLAATLAPLRHRDFRRLWAGTFFATGGQWVQQATLGWVVYHVTGSAKTGFTFNDFSIQQPRVPVVLSVADSIHLELDFDMVPDAVKH